LDSSLNLADKTEQEGNWGKKLNERAYRRGIEEGEIAMVLGHKSTVVYWTYPISFSTSIADAYWSQAGSRQALAY